MFGSTLASLQHRPGFAEAALKMLPLGGRSLSPNDLQQQLYRMTTQHLRSQRATLGADPCELSWFLVGFQGWLAFSAHLNLQFPDWCPDLSSIDLLGPAAMDRDVFNLELLRVAALDLGINTTHEELADFVSQIAAKCESKLGLHAIDLAAAYFAETVSYLSSAAVRSGHRTKLHTPAMSSFISYSHTNEDWIDSLANFLEGHAVRVWLAPFDLRSGVALDSRLKQAIEVHECLVVILTADSLTSQWVTLEIATAVEQRKEVMPVSLVPITDVKRSELWSELSRFLILDCSALSPIDAYREVLRNLQRKNLDLTRWRADEGLLDLFTGKPNPIA